MSMVIHTQLLMHNNPKTKVDVDYNVDTWNIKIEQRTSTTLSDIFQALHEVCGKSMLSFRTISRWIVINKR